VSENPPLPLRLTSIACRSISGCRNGATKTSSFPLCPDHRPGPTLLKNSFRGISRTKFARKLLNLRLPYALKFTEITALVPFSTATGVYTMGEMLEPASPPGQPARDTRSGGKRRRRMPRRFPAASSPAFPLLAARARSANSFGVRYPKLRRSDRRAFRSFSPKSTRLQSARQKLRGLSFVRLRPAEPS
jgi:hypothetical protein